MQARPLSQWVLVRKSEPDDQTKSGLYLPDQAKDRPQQGEVLAVGPGRWTERGGWTPMQVKPGERVLFNPYGYHEIKEPGREASLFMIREEDIFAIVVEE